MGRQNKKPRLFISEGTGHQLPRYHPGSGTDLSIPALDARNVCLRHRLLSFICAALVGISVSYVDLGRLSAGGLPSLTEHKYLLYTFIAFGYKIYLHSSHIFKKSQAFLKKAFDFMAASL